MSNEKIFPGGIKVKALFTPNMKWRLVEEFGPNCFTETDDGRPVSYTHLDVYKRQGYAVYAVHKSSLASSTAEKIQVAALGRTGTAERCV